MTNLKEGPVKGRSKCLPPRNGLHRWCAVLGAVINSTNTTRRLFVYDSINIKTGKFHVLGIATRIGGRHYNRPVLFNFCPWCDAKLDFFTKEQKQHKQQKAKKGS